MGNFWIKSKQNKKIVFYFQFGNGTPQKIAEAADLASSLSVSISASGKIAFTDSSGNSFKLYGEIEETK